MACSLSFLDLDGVKALNGVELVLPGAPAPKWSGSLFDQNWYVVGCLPIHPSSLRLSPPNNFADRQHARIHRAASDVLLVTCKRRHGCRFWALHGLSGVPIGALLVVVQQWFWVASG